MKVYVLVVYSWDRFKEVGVFATREAAMAEGKELEEHCEKEHLCYCCEAEIHEMEVQ